MIILTVLIIGSAALDVLAEYQGSRRGVYLFKPLTVALIILVALQAKNPVPPFYRQMIIAGLLCSLVGDIFLMLPSDRFIPGLLSFLLAHLFYIAAFAFAARPAFVVWSLIPFLLYGGLMLCVLWRGLGKMRAPLVIYLLAILLMGWAAVSRWLAAEQGGSLAAMLGALCFIASDSVLAVDRFRGHFRSAQFWILTTYFTAQWLIALST
ncbi:MAG TPA: lysoplasmalogenase [Pyrinomonadaceae bacterium]